MNSSAIAYQLPTFIGCLSHGWNDARFVRDVDDEQEASVNYRIEAQVRSGDYFVTLATTLDSLAQSSSDYDTQRALEGMVSDLMYIQDNYEIKASRNG
jgi:hypothetical protein